MWGMEFCKNGQQRLWANEGYYCIWKISRHWWGSSWWVVQEIFLGDYGIITKWKCSGYATKWNRQRLEVVCHLASLKVTQGSLLPSLLLSLRPSLILSLLPSLLLPLPRRMIVRTSIGTRQWLMMKRGCLYWNMLLFLVMCQEKSSAFSSSQKNLYSGSSPGFISLSHILARRCGNVNWS